MVIIVNLLCFALFSISTWYYYMCTLRAEKMYFLLCLLKPIEECQLFQTKHNQTPY